MNINWQIIDNGKGKNASIPEAIDSLWSSDQFERKNNGYHWLKEVVSTGLDLHEAAYYIIEPIIERLIEPYTTNKAYQFKLLSKIALCPDNKKTFVSQETGATLNLVTSCRNKLMSLKERINLIETRDYDEVREKKYLLDIINLFNDSPNEKTSKINWKSIKSAVGSCEFIPLAIAKLWSENEEEREWQGYYELDNVVVLQSTLFEGAYYVIEPIVEGLEKDYTVNRLYPLRVLVEITGGSSNAIVTLQDTGETVNITEACRKKIFSLKERIAAIEVREADEIEEKAFLLEEIERFCNC